MRRISSPSRWLADRITVSASPFSFQREKETVNKIGKSVRAKERRAGWIFLTPATILILVMSFWPMIQAFITSFKSGKGSMLTWANPWNFNYARILQDKIFITSLKNTATIARSVAK